MEEISIIVNEQKGIAQKWQELFKNKPKDLILEDSGVYRCIKLNIIVLAKLLKMREYESESPRIKAMISMLVSLAPGRR